MSKANYWCDDQLFRANQQQLGKQYTQNDVIADEHQIPKLIHFVWLGSELPAHCQQIVQKCIDLHPGWKVIVWKEEEIERLTSFTNCDLYANAPNFGM
jgi:mannosyltransferase OCH1-like enzyme